MWAAWPRSRPCLCLQSGELSAKQRGQLQKGRAPFLIEVMGAWPRSSRDKEFQLGLREPLMGPAWKPNDTPFPGGGAGPSSHCVSRAGQRGRAGPFQGSCARSSPTCPGWGLPTHCNSHQAPSSLCSRLHQGNLSYKGSLGKSRKLITGITYNRDSALICKGSQKCRKRGALCPK